MKPFTLARALLLASLLSIPFATGRGQTRSADDDDMWEAMPAARVVLVPAVDRFDIAWATSTAIKDHRVLAVYATGGPVSRALATRVQASVGGPIISLDRAARSVDDFARMMVDTIVEKTARSNTKRSILVVIEPDLILPFLRGAFSWTRQPPPFVLGTYIILVRADNARRLSVRPSTLDRPGGQD